MGDTGGVRRLPANAAADRGRVKTSDSGERAKLTGLVGWQRRELDRMRSEAAARSVIDVATGMLMEQLSCSAAEARPDEFHGRGISKLGLADRATISNMSPEFGATATLFPIDDETLRYLRMTGRAAETVARVEAYAKEQGLFRTDDSLEPLFSESLSLDLADVDPSVAGPRRPQDRVPLTDLQRSFREVFAGGNGGRRSAILLNAAGAIAAAGHAEDLREGLEVAREALDSGAAAERLDALIAFSRGAGG